MNEVRVILVLVTHFTNRYLCDTNYFYPFRSDYWFCRNTSENKNENYYENLLLRIKKDSQLQQRDAASKRCVPCQKEHILVSKRVSLWELYIKVTTPL